MSGAGAVQLAESHGITVEKVTRLLPVTEGVYLSDRLDENECYSYSHLPDDEPDGFAQVLLGSTCRGIKKSPMFFGRLAGRSILLLYLVVCR